MLPGTKCVWGAALGDKMAISAVSQAGISFQQMHSSTAASKGNIEQK